MSILVEKPQTARRPRAAGIPRPVLHPALRILFATDGSPGSEAAAGFLAGLSLRDCAISMLTVTSSEKLGEEDQVLRGAWDHLHGRTVMLDGQVRHGHPAEEIVRAASEEAVDLIVLGSHGRSALARFLLGSVAERVAQHAPCPVLVVRGAPPALRRIVLGVDGSEGSRRAAEWLRRFPLPKGCEIRLLTMVSGYDRLLRERFTLTPPLTDRPISFEEWELEGARCWQEEIASMFAVTGRQVVTEIRSGEAASGLVDAGRDEGADLLVVGSHGQSALERFLLGSVSENVLTHASCSVLVVRPTVGTERGGTSELSAQPA